MRYPIDRHHKPYEHECRESINVRVSRNRRYKFDVVRDLHEQICLVILDTACDPAQNALRQYGSEFAKSSTDAVGSASVASWKYFCRNDVGCSVGSYVVISTSSYTSRTLTLLTKVEKDLCQDIQHHQYRRPLRIHQLAIACTDYKEQDEKPEETIDLDHAST